MKSNLLVAATVTLLSLSAARPASAQLNGEPYIHDPSSVAYDNGKYYTFGTGSGGLISDDGGWTWHSGAVRTGGGVAPDIIKIGDKYLRGVCRGRRRNVWRPCQQRQDHVDEDPRPQVTRLRVSR